MFYYLKYPLSTKIYKICKEESVIHSGKTEASDFKEAMINMFRELKITMLKEVEEDIAITYEIENINNEIKKEKVEILELKNTLME